MDCILSVLPCAEKREGILLWQDKILSLMACSLAFSVADLQANTKTESNRHKKIKFLLHVYLFVKIGNLM